MEYIGFIYLTVDKTDVGFCQVATNRTGKTGLQSYLLQNRPRDRVPYIDLLHSFLNEAGQCKIKINYEIHREIG